MIKEVTVYSFPQDEDSLPTDIEPMDGRLSDNVVVLVDSDTFDGAPSATDLHRDVCCASVQSIDMLEDIDTVKK